MQNTAQLARPGLSPSERQAEILEKLREEGRLAVAPLAACFATSDDSIRRDLRTLADAGLIRRVHGAILPAGPPVLSLDERSRTATAEKRAIGEAAVRHLAAGSTVFLDGGTTVLAAAAAIPPDLSLEVVTTSLPVAACLADYPSVRVVLIGGSLDPASRTVVGAGTVESIRAIRAAVCLLGLCSLDVDAGVTATGFEEARVKRAMIEASDRVIALATPDKIDTVSPHAVATADRLDRLITAPPLPEAALDRYGRLGVAVETAIA